jgi:hypothetical protein
MPEQRSPAVVVGGDEEVGVSAFGLFVHPAGFEHGFGMAHRGSSLRTESHDQSKLKYSIIMKRGEDAGSATVKCCSAFFLFVLTSTFIPRIPYSNMHAMAV